MGQVAAIVKQAVVEVLVLVLMPLPELEPKVLASKLVAVVTKIELASTLTIVALSKTTMELLSQNSNNLVRHIPLDIVHFTPCFDILNQSSTMAVHTFAEAIVPEHFACLCRLRN